MIRTDEVASSAPAKHHRARRAQWRGWTACLASVAATLGMAFIPGLGATPAGATAPTVTTITGSGGATAPSLGDPVAAGSAKISPTYVARASNGDVAVAETKAGSVFVYLIPATAENNVYNIQTAPNPNPAFGTLTEGDAYIVAGTGTAGLIPDPGNPQFGDEAPANATANPITPTSVAFDPQGNLLIAGASSGASAIQVVAKASGMFYGVSMTAGNLYTVADVGLSGSPSSAINMGDVTAVANGMSVDPNGNIAVGNGNGVDFVNEQPSGSLSLYGQTIAHQSSALVAGFAEGATNCSAGAANASATSLFVQSPEPFIDSSDNIYFNDNESGSVGGGCDWVLPAQTGTLDGMSVTAGNAYKLAGNGGTSATPDGTAGVNANVAGTSEMTVDAAGNVVLGVSGLAAGTSPAIQVLSENTCVSSCDYGLASTTAGDVYTIAGGSSDLLATLAGPTSILFAGSGNMLFTDGPTSSANLDQLSGGPTAPEPVVTGLSPSSGPTAGGTSVTITGTGLTGATAVHFGLAAATITGNTDTSVTATSPAGTGEVDVTVTTAGGTSVTSDSDQFTYVAAPTVTAVSPSQGPAGGGTSVVITGTGLTGATAVNFGGTAATGLTANTDTSITVTSPAGTGTVDVTVTTPGGTSATGSADKFSYLGTPTVTAVNPNAGPLGGGTIVTITGTGFATESTVAFGVTAATNVTVNSLTSITATSPAGTGTVDVTVTTPEGTSSTSPSDDFSYLPVPTVTNRNISSGPATGGTSVSIVGTGFVAGESTVDFGSNAATGVVVNSDTSITATSPAGSGTVHITVTTPGGTSATSTNDEYTYVPAPTVTSVSPTSGPAAGGTTVTITGSNFGIAPTVKFGNTTASGVSTNSPTSISATSPAGSGTVDITVTSLGGTSATSAADHFTYLTVPGAPTGVTASAGDGQASLSWTAPGNNGGAVITGYTVTSSPGSLHCTTTGSTSCTVTGLTNGTAYTFTVTATNSQGTGPASAASTAVTPAPAPHSGYWLVASDGGIFNYGDAGFFGSTGAIHLNKPIVGMASTFSGNGYWLVASDGGIFNYGDAGFFGSAGAIHLNQPIVGMAPTLDGNGYWLVASDGGIFNYGDAGFFGSAGAIHLNKPIVGMTPTPDGKGYWLVASDGGIFNYGDAGFFGSTGAIHLNEPIVGMAATPTGNGYWLVAADGGIFNYGDAGFFGSTGAIHLNKPIVGMGTTHDGKGYWLVASDGGIFNYGDAAFDGSAGGTPLNKPIVGMAAHPETS